jgi:hypothetical protein
MRTISHVGERYGAVQASRVGVRIHLFLVPGNGRPADFTKRGVRGHR